MNVWLSGKAFLLLLAASLIGYAFSVIGVANTPIDSVWKLVALSLGVAIILGYGYPVARGVKKGDTMLAISRREVTHGNSIHSLLDQFLVTALENGRSGEKIRVRIAGGKSGEGVIAKYAGTLSPAQIKLTESER